MSIVHIDVTPKKWDGGVGLSRWSNSCNTLSMSYEGSKPNKKKTLCVGKVHMRYTHNKIVNKDNIIFCIS